jgi:threonine aldolase
MVDVAQDVEALLDDGVALAVLHVGDEADAAGILLLGGIVEALVPTGTAANALSLAHVTPPWGGVLCHEQAHIMSDECGAPEFFGGGLKLIGLRGAGCKLSRDTVSNAIARYSGHVPHQVNASALSITQATEAGTVYRVDEIAALAEIAHARGLAVHMDGARFANALARMNVTPAEATWKAGIDVLSFGATKGGAMAAEAVVFFDRKRADFMPERRKRAGQLLSKHRFLAAQFEGYLNDGYWLTLARHANAMADRLADGLRACGVHDRVAGRRQYRLRTVASGAGCEIEGSRGRLLRSAENACRR